MMRTWVSKTVQLKTSKTFSHLTDFKVLGERGHLDPEPVSGVLALPDGEAARPQLELDDHLLGEPTPLDRGDAPLHPPEGVLSLLPLAHPPARKYPYFVSGKSTAILTRMPKPSHKCTVSRTQRFLLFLYVLADNMRRNLSSYIYIT